MLIFLKFYFSFIWFTYSYLVIFKTKGHIPIYLNRSFTPKNQYLELMTEIRNVVNHQKEYY